jgi:hypothetical protein
MGGACSTYVREVRCIQVLVGKPEGKRPLGRPRRRLDHYIKMEIQEEGCGSMDGIDLSQDKCRWGSCKSGNEPSACIKWEEFLH